MGAICPALKMGAYLLIHRNFFNKLRTPSNDICNRMKFLKEVILVILGLHKNHWDLVDFSKLHHCPLSYQFIPSSSLGSIPPLRVLYSHLINHLGHYRTNVLYSHLINHLGHYRTNKIHFSRSIIHIYQTDLIFTILHLCVFAFNR
jgi:hypothetical protein